MCGICGVFNFDVADPADAAELLRMRDIQAHRGPDGAGIHLDGPAGLAHRRLSIIDVEGGAQPLSNEAGDVWITFNGEIYNYRPLMDGLRRRGHRFLTASDTEVVVHLYEELGVSCLREFNGIFALAIWDARLRRLFLARDRLGIKPLHYCQTSDGLRFASEIKGVLSARGVVCEPNMGSFREYLMFRHVFGRRTLFHRIDALEPGTYLLADAEGVQQHRYWTIGAPERLPENDASWQDRIDEVLTQSVQMQMVSDVPLGTFCSGGIDSSLITALAAQAHPEPLNTYSIGYSAPEWDERPFARLVSERYATVWHDIEISGAMFSQALAAAQRCNDEPLSHPSSVPLYLLSRLARETVKVVLSGEGSDEAFTGYPRHLVVAAHHRMRHLPSLVRKMTGVGLEHLPSRRGRLLGSSFRRSLRDALLFNAAFMAPEAVHALVEPDVPDHGLGERRAVLEAAESDDPLRTLAQFELATYLSIALERLDRMSMAHGLEARVPFLDHRLIELAVAAPTHLKLHGLANKWIVRRIARSQLPGPVISRRKVGFGVPVSIWMRTEPTLRDAIKALPTSSLVRDQVIQGSAVNRMVNEHVAGVANHVEGLWLLMNLAHWYGRIQSGRFLDTTGAP